MHAQGIDRSGREASGDDGASRVAIRRVPRQLASGATLLAMAAVLGCAPPEAPLSEVPNTPARMAGIVAALQTALPAAQDQDAFASPARREEIGAALRELARNASALELHGGDETPGFRFFSRRLADDAGEISKRFHAGSHDEARFLLNQVVDDCAGCHVRLPDLREHAVGVPLTASLEAAPARTRVKLLVATRQFDAALTSYEALFAATESPPSALDFEGLLEDYLVVAVRVRSDFARADRGLAALQARGDAPPYLAHLLASWRAALAELAPFEDGSTLVDARKVLDRANAQRRYPADRSALVHDLVASALLHRALARGLGSPDETAEASYLLGLAELRNDPSRGLPQAEAYLESAIRAAPNSDIARDAYGVLEEQTVLGWMGSAGLDMPRDVSDWLGELRALAGLREARP
jgi:tetratricopeptide (TPR) repeat protein